MLSKFELEMTVDVRLAKCSLLTYLLPMLELLYRICFSGHSYMQQDLRLLLHCSG
jgi:hypothetical protein